MKMLIYNFQMGGDSEGNKNMINIPIRIEKTQDHDNQKIGGFTTNKVTFSETTEVCFFSRNQSKIIKINKYFLLVFVIFFITSRNF